MVVYRTYQLESPQVDWNEELEGILPKGWVETELGKALFKQASTSKNKLIESRSDWSEKVVWELTKLIKLPAARYELAKVVDGDREIPGSISLDCSIEGDEKRYPIEELLRARLPSYDFPEDYTINNALSVLANTKIQLPPNYEVPDGIKDGADLFVGIIMLDAWIGNSDRHDRNLEIVKQADGSVYLSPIFDNGNSLGATEKRELRANVSIEDYSQNYNEACFVEEEKDLTGQSAFELAAAIRPQAAKIWLKQLSFITEQQINQIFERIPDERITQESALFARQLLTHNKTQLLELSRQLNPSPSIESQKRVFRQEYKRLKGQVQQNPNFHNAPVEELDLAIAMLVIKEAANKGLTDNLINRVAEVLSQSDQLREWKGVMPEAEYKATAFEYLLNKFDLAIQIRENILASRQEQDLEFER